MDKNLPIAIDTISIPQQFIAEAKAQPYKKRNGFKGDFLPPKHLTNFLYTTRQPLCRNTLKNEPNRSTSKRLFK
jgi:hypothetical protein